MQALDAWSVHGYIKQESIKAVSGTDPLVFNELALLPFFSETKTREVRYCSTKKKDQFGTEMLAKYSCSTYCCVVPVCNLPTQESSIS
jgi:hypothetical protein